MEIILKHLLYILATAVATALGLGFATGGMTDQLSERQTPARLDNAESNYSGANVGGYRGNRRLVACPVSKYWMVTDGGSAAWG
jgi:hypothetical protein